MHRARASGWCSTTRTRSRRDAGVDPNQLVVHQSDLQAVVNALWAGGAEAMTIAGQRVIATSAVRCVGNTLLLNGRVFSPPFEVAAIGPFGQCVRRWIVPRASRCIARPPSYYGLGYTVEQSATLHAAGLHRADLAYLRKGGDRSDEWQH